MTTVAFLFPGQGSQMVGMGRDLCEQFEVAHACFEEADSRLGFSLSRLCFEGPQEELILTANTQPAVLAASIACQRVLEEAGVRPAVAAGHSLGEYSALVAGGVMGFGDALAAVRRRGQLMQDAVPPGEGAMAAVLGLEEDAVRTICREASALGVVEPANLNGPGQIVLSGNSTAVARAGELAREAGARKVVFLEVSAPFHSSLLRVIEKPLEQELSRYRYEDPACPVLANVDARPYGGRDEVIPKLVGQVSAPVQWLRIMERVLSMKVDAFLEVGPGRVLTAMMRRMDRDLPGYAVGDVAGVRAALEALPRR